MDEESPLVYVNAITYPCHNPAGGLAKFLLIKVAQGNHHTWR